MSNRLTVKATDDGLAKAKMALKRLHGTQLDLAKNLTGLVGRSTIQKFFKGEEIQIDKFKDICKALTLESQWEAIANLTDLPDNQPPEPIKEEQDNSIHIDSLLQEIPEKEKSHIQVGSGNYNESIKGHYTQGNHYQGNTIYYVNKSDVAKPSKPLIQNSTNIDALVQKVCSMILPYIQERCGTMRVLDMTQPIGLSNIYTDVNILEKITGRMRCEIAELLQNFEREDFDRFGLGKVTEKRVSGLKAVQEHSKLMVLGKPGAF
ncbi:MAG: hypothetical protein PUP91_26120 [Rhizonema sp. PD37]|nr:hypothetical protein [Rhizonema sp. PD37]